jgi:hypothetical protein
VSVESDQDPFGERPTARWQRKLRVLGADFAVSSNSRELLRLLDAAFAQLPNHRLVSRPPRMRVHLLLCDQPAAKTRGNPPPLQLHGADGLLIGAMDAANFAAVSLSTRSALVCVSRAMLAFPYHVRYELIEFAFMTLAPRVLGLVPLHSACVGLDGRGLLLNGASGAGKSTLSVACVAGGFDLLAEDGVFVEPVSLRATGCANFLHLHEDSLRLLSQARLRAAFRRSPVIRRRSGALKFELDARRARLPLSRQPLQLAVLVMLSSRSARGSALLEPLARAECRAILQREQPYAAGQPGWKRFCDRLMSLPAYRMLRASHPDLAVSALRELVAEHPR